MRLEPSEEAMYQRMDRKDRILYLIPFSGSIGSVIFLLCRVNHMQNLSISFFAIVFVLILFLAVQYCKLNRQIMPLSDCFLEIQKECLFVRQPEQQDRYESCQIYFKEIESLIWNRGKDGFFIRFHENGKSQVFCNGKQMGTIFHVRIFGYGEEEMKSVYQMVKERLPVSAKVYEP